MAARLNQQLYIDGVATCSVGSRVITCIVGGVATCSVGGVSEEESDSPRSHYFVSQQANRGPNSISPKDSSCSPHPLSSTVAHSGHCTITQVQRHKD